MGSNVYSSTQETECVYSTAFVYGQDGQRSNKYTGNSETLYFNKMWTHHTDSGNSIYGGQTSKNIYLGETRIVTKLNSGEDPTYQEEYYKQYYYHSDHLGSASMISDYKGNEYQRIEYTPYGETWVEKTSNTGLEYLSYKFTAKELDEETGLYYYGARYLDPRYSMWISTDPALGEYIPQAPVNDEIRKNNQNLPGMGGIFNHINSNLYHYAGNNPVRFTDPTGREDENLINNEIKVEYFLDNIKKHPDDYSFDVYQRKALGEGKRNELMLHSLYVVTDKSNGEETTLSFNGTKIGLNSTGAWATNTEMDVNSYESYKDGANAYDMVHLVPNNMIDTKTTASNILNSIKSGTTYFAIDHKINKCGAENCNTALFNTLTIKQTLPRISLPKNGSMNIPSQTVIKNGK